MCGLDDRTSHCASLNNLVQPHIFYRICQKGISAPNYYWGDSKNQLTHEVIVKTCRNVCTVENEVVFEKKRNQFGTNNRTPNLPWYAPYILDLQAMKFRV